MVSETRRRRCGMFFSKKYYSLLSPSSTEKTSRPDGTNKQCMDGFKFCYECLPKVGIFMRTLW